MLFGVTVTRSKTLDLSLNAPWPIFLTFVSRRSNSTLLQLSKAKPPIVSICGGNSNISRIIHDLKALLPIFANLESDPNLISIRLSHLKNTPSHISCTVDYNMTSRS